MTITNTPPQEVPDNNDSARRRALSRWFRRAKQEPEYEEVVDSPGTELAVPAEQIEGWAWVNKYALQLPDARHVRARVRHAAPKIPGIMLRLFGHKLPVMVWSEVVTPIWVGTGKCVVAYHGWVTAAGLSEAKQSAEGNLKSRHAADQHAAHGYRVWATLIGGAVVSGGMAYLYYVHSTAFFIVVIVILGVLDLIGRTDKEKPKETILPAHRQPIYEGISYQQLTASIQDAFNETVGTDNDSNPLVRCDGLCTMDYDRDEWRQMISTYQEIKPAHIEYVERALGARLRSVKLLEVAANSTRKIVVIRHGDPLADVPSAPDDPAGSCSITDPAPLGASKDPDRSFALGIAGVHVIIVAATGGGKTVHFDNLIDYVSKCKNAVVWGINIAKRHAFSKWRGCIQKVGRDPDEAAEVLDAALAEIQRRLDILDELAQSDDPSVHTDKWDPNDPRMGPALVIFIDEYAQIAKYNGTPKGSLNLLEKVEDIGRLGREVMVSFVLAFQKWGNADAGSTIISSQSTVVICGPCSPDDAGEIFGYKARDHAGWTPHLLKPANDYGINDAGKAFVLAPGFGPDEVRGWKPRGVTDNIRVANERVKQGLPQLVTQSQDDDIEDATVVPAMLGALEMAFDYFAPKDGWLPSKMAADWISEQTGEKVSQPTLAKALKTELAHLEEGLVPETRSTRNELAGNCYCYAWDDVRAALGAL